MKRQKNLLICPADEKSADDRNMQLRVACTDGQMQAVRYLLERGADPFKVVSQTTLQCPNISTLL